MLLRFLARFCYSSHVPPEVNFSDETTPAEMDHVLAPNENGSAKRVPPGSALRESSRIRRGAFGGRPVRPCGSHFPPRNHRH